MIEFFRSSHGSGQTPTVRLKSRLSDGRNKFSSAIVTVCAILFVCNSQMHCAATLVNHIVEVPATSPSTLSDGNLRFLSGLKPTGSSMSGVFIHLTKTATASVGHVPCQLF